MKFKKPALSFFVIGMFFFIGFFLIHNLENNVKPKNFSDIKYVEIAGQKIKIDLALTVAEHSRGLSLRNGLKENEGMLFVFDKPDKYPFWMKDMKFPIDIIWLGEDMKTIYIKKNALPSSYPESYEPENPNEDTKYVLEVISGFAEKNNLKEGDEMVFTF